MSRYGIDYYGASYYGSGTTVKYDAYPFTAKPYGYGYMALNWVNPGGDWAKIRIVRNKYGYPIDAWDGQIIVDAYNNAVSDYHLDGNNLEQGSFYYYSIFVLELEQYSWVRAANTMGVSVKKYNNGDRMYEYMPEIYKIAEPYSASTKLDNPDLYDFLSLFGFEADYIQTITRLLAEKYDTQKMHGNFVPILMNQNGVVYEPEIGLQQNRILLRNGVLINKERGGREGLIEFLKSYTGYAVNSVTVGHNLMLDYNDSSFEESTGHWISVDGTADMDNLQTFDIKKVQLSSNVATLYIGANNYDVGNEVLVSGLPFPLFNSLTAYTLTGVDQTSYVQFALTGSDLALTSGYNQSTGAYGLLTPSPEPWVEPTAPSLFPNKSKGILALYNKSTSSQTISAFVGDNDPINKGVPVTAGLDYSFSIYASKGGYTARTVTAKIKWYNRFGVLLSTSSGTGVSDNTVVFSSSYRPHVTATAPATAAYACPGVSIASVGGSASGEHHYFDAAQLEQASAVTDFDEARQLHITLRASRINELINPNFESPLTPWDVTGATSTAVSNYKEAGVDTYVISSASITSNVATVTLTTPHYFKVGESVYISGVTGASAANYNGARTITAVSLYGFSYNVTASNSSVSGGTVYKTSHAIKLTASSSNATLKSWDGSTTSELMGIYYPGSSYTFSAYVLAGTTSENVTAAITWYDNSYSVINTATGNVTSTSTADWVRPSVTSAAPNNAAFASVTVSWTTTSGNILIVDKALFEKSDFVLDYFDGSSGPADAPSLIWEGGVLGANNSRSHYYKNRYVVQLRLNESLSPYLPLGSTYAIYLAQPLT